MNHEETARKKHRAGNNCATSVYTAFSDIDPNMGRAPAPRSEEGKCGAVLSAEKILRELGIGRVSEFDTRFEERFGSLKCAELLKSGESCSDFVGEAAAILDTLLG